MDNNDILRRMRYALHLRDIQMVDIFKMAEEKVSIPEVRNLLLKESDEEYLQCNDEILEKFLDGLIIKHRGKQEPKPDQKPSLHEILNNNVILRKIRIAMELREQAMLTVLELGGMDVSKTELGALFRRRNHAHYMPCGDQLLRNFLKGLAIYLGKHEDKETPDSPDEE